MSGQSELSHIRLQPRDLLHYGTQSLRDSSSQIDIFNCYSHWPLLVLRNRNGEASFLHSREGVTQGGAQAMFAYGKGILLLIKNLKAGFPDITHTCYTENSVLLGIFARVEAFFYSLKLHGLVRGYYPEPSKIDLIVHPNNIEARKSLARAVGLRCAQVRVIMAVISVTTGLNVSV